jgi:hypothetical protein
LREELKISTKKNTYTIPIIAIINSLSSDRKQNSNNDLYNNNMHQKKSKFKQKSKKKAPFRINRKNNISYKIHQINEVSKFHNNENNFSTSNSRTTPNCKKRFF